jgi:hypothetical protein
VSEYLQLLLVLSYHHHHHHQGSRQNKTGREPHYDKKQEGPTSSCLLPLSAINPVCFKLTIWSPGIIINNNKKYDECRRSEEGDTYTGGGQQQRQHGDG